MAAGLQEYEDEACHHRHGDEQQWADPVQPAEPCVSQCVVISALWCIGHAGGYLLRGIISIPAPLFKRGWHIVARFLHFCCRWRKKRAARGGFARSGALGLPGAGHGLAACLGVSTRCLTCLGVDLSKPEWCFALAADYSSSSPAINKMGSVTGAVTTRPTPSAVLPKRVKGASTATAVSMLRG